MSSNLKRCSVPQCNDTSSRRFSLPRNEKLKNIWIRRAGCEHLLKNLKTCSGFMCSRHFHDVCFKPDGRLLLNSLPTKYLPGFKGASSKENCFFRQYMPSAKGSETLKKIQGEPANSEDPPIIDLAPQNVGSELLAKPAVTEYHMDIGVSSMDDQSKNNVVYELKTLANESNSTLLNEDHPVENLELPTDDTSLSINITSNLCRLCLENSPQMWNFFSIITLDDQSTIDVVVAFEKLTGEHVEEHENSRLPKHICQACLDLLVCAHLFKQKYEKSSTILKSLLTENCESVEIVKSEESCTEDNETGHESVLIPESTTDFSIAVDDIQELSDDDVASSPQPEIEPQSVRKRKREEGNQTFQHSCPICLKQFSALELKRHCQSHNSLQRYLKAAPKFNQKVRFFARPKNNVSLFNRQPVSHVCPFCSEEFDSKAFFIHVRQHRQEGNYRCNICNRIFLGRNHLKFHQLSHKKESPYKCEECGKGFFRQANFDYHKLSHTMSDDLPFKCKYCAKSYSNPEALKRHTFHHENDMPYGKHYSLNKDYVTCRHCQQKLKSSVDLEQHTCRFCCAKCHKIFETKKEFNKHVCKYKLKISKCDPCGKTFQLPSSHKAHKYRCGFGTLCYVCGKNVSNISQHLQYHFGKKKAIFKCADCGKQFQYKDSLSRHINQTHFSLYQCEYCSKTFASKWSLTAHEDTHTGQKEHVCNICGKTFTLKSSLNRHMTVHVLDLPGTSNNTFSPSNNDRITD
ncbi:zinc finger protein 37 isoform X3 [Dendroctonus ponderosae]|uniref:zinc finger protein 37 isoform X3 n=1 Tax=Dendroctonus ponderosae TaxID=77166 RepID=UPI00203596E5|nr:zinc finger protein 37 isoform X3 [Dendroctonus ponderosae]